jgi:hypothetical protein
MEKFTVVAKVRFEIEDVDLAHANRQAMASIALMLGKGNPLSDEYPVLNAPYAVGGDFEIRDAEGKVVQTSSFEQDEEPASE